MYKPVLSLLVAAAALAAVPAAGQDRSGPQTGPVHNSHYRDPLPTMLRARIASINLRIDLLREQGAIGSEVALELRQQSRRLHSRLHGLSTRDARDVESAIDRLERRVGFAMDDARWGAHAFARDFEDRHVDRDRDEQRRQEAERHGDYDHFDRYTGSSVDRWHDPFDRGNER